MRTWARCAGERLGVPPDIEVDSLLVFLCIATYNTFGNFAPFYQIATASLLDGVSHRIRLLPFLMFYFLLNIWTITAGWFLAIGDRIFKREA